ncbi:unnamed protein product [Darwinula stevensoni]|uniref:Type VII secretion system protein EssD-like domain-containing protein n=1 Tax=Darwinula stevensoni TaxID=69355 RepID=A0A7R8X7Q8_9CRUS|nr:unnamed protein product [Darwinula stevensoni]CAG0882581.1 unnamed protein product [Darwinula stevensoni]
MSLHQRSGTERSSWRCAAKSTKLSCVSYKRRSKPSKQRTVCFKGIMDYPKMDPIGYFDKNPLESIQKGLKRLQQKVHEDDQASSEQQAKQSKENAGRRTKAKLMVTEKEGWNLIGPSRARESQRASVNPNEAQIHCKKEELEHCKCTDKKCEKVHCKKENCQNNCKVIKVTVEARVHRENLRQGTVTNKKIRDGIKKLDHPGLVAGHIIAKLLGGSGTDWNNIVPMDNVFNNGAYKSFESEIREWIEKYSGMEAWIEAYA